MKKTAILTLSLSSMLLAVSCAKSGKAVESDDGVRQDSVDLAAQMAEKAKQDSLQKTDSNKNIVTPDMAIFDVKGPVKRISWENGHVAEFNAQGSLTSMKYGRTKYSIRRNNEGYITKCDTWYNPDNGAAGGMIGGSFTYDEMHRVASFSTELGTEGNWREVETYTYDAQGHVAKVTATEKNLDWETEKWTSGERSSRNCSCSGEDEYGNWQNASVSYGIYQSYPPTKSFARHIEYYSSSEI